MTKLLVTGTQGQVAQSLKAQTATHEVVLVGRPDLDLANPKLAEIEILKAIELHKPDVIVNAAAYTAVDKAETEVDLAMTINGISAGAVAKAAAQHGLPVIQLSTDYVFDGTNPTPYTEDDAVNPVSSYGRSKLAGEQAVAAANPKHIIVRTAWVYSPFGNNFVKTMLQLAQTRDELGVVADQTGNPTSAFDIADGIFAIATQIITPAFTSWGVYHLAGTGSASWAEFAQEIFRISAQNSKANAKVKAITTADYPTPAKRPANSQLAGAKLKTTFGWQAREWQVALREVIVGI
jgi:dTDP-4-dehydrorhamnose reductase